MGRALISAGIFLGAACHAAAGDNCDSVVVSTIEKVFHANSTFNLATNLLKGLQSTCAKGGCPKVTLPGCDPQSIDDVHCKVSAPTFSTNIGGDSICDAGCSDWPCKAACQGIDVGICYGADYVLCKAGCLGISSCVHKCEHAIVDPCKQKLIDECSHKCEVAFASCKEKCEKELALDVNLDFQFLQRAISSLSVQGLSTNCSGSGVWNPMAFSIDSAVAAQNVAVGLDVGLEIAGLKFHNQVTLSQVQITVGLPISGSLQCNPLGAKQITAHAGAASVSHVDLDVDLKLDAVLATIAASVCADLEVCKDAIKSGIQNAIKRAIVSQVPSLVAGVLSKAINTALAGAKCPKVSAEEEPAAPMVV